MFQSPKKSFRLHTLANDKIGHRIQRSQTFSRRVNTLQNQQLLLKSKIKSISSSKKLLSPFKQYQTKLQLSAESWMVYDVWKNAYKRGWNPNKISQFDGLLRMVVVYISSLINKYLKLDNIQIRLNTSCLLENRISNFKKTSNKFLQIKQPQKISQSLSNNTIIKFNDLIYGMIMTAQIDLLQYSIIHLGYLIYLIKNKKQFQNGYYYIQSIQLADFYRDIFLSYCNEEIFTNLLGLTKTSLKKPKQFNSTANQICKIFIQAIKEKYFRDALIADKINTTIRYQVGFKFWEERQKKFINQRIKLNDYLTVMNFKGRKNYSIVAYNRKLNIIMVLEDCKFGMSECDIKRVQEWVKAVNKPIVSPQHKKHGPKLKPLLDLLDKNIHF